MNFYQDSSQDSSDEVIEIEIDPTEWGGVIKYLGLNIKSLIT